jgi:hypothetical protein
MGLSLDEVLEAAHSETGTRRGLFQKRLSSLAVEATTRTVLMTAAI